MGIVEEMRMQQWEKEIKEKLGQDGVIRNDTAR